MQTSVREILAEVDKDNDGRIDYQEFCDMMRGQVRVRASEALVCAKVVHICAGVTCSANNHSDEQICHICPADILMLTFFSPAPVPDSSLDMCGAAPDPARD